MSHYQYLIVGGGMTADAAARGNRKVDQTGSIGLFSLENHPPYDRPPLSKGLWKGRPLERIWRKTADLGVELHLGNKIESLDPNLHRVIDSQGQEHIFERLLIATGGKPIRLPETPDKIIYYRTLDDFQKLKNAAEIHERFVVIGGGFIGSEIAVALANLKKKVTMIFLEDGIGARIFPTSLALFLNEYYRSHGVEVLTGQSVASIEDLGKEMVVKTKSGQAILADSVVAGLGIRPNVALAQAAGLSIDNGITVDQNLQTSHPDIYAAGDVISVFNPILEMRLRVEHEDNANSSGMSAGAAMAGNPAPYDHLSFFYSDIFDLGYEAVGDLNPALEIVEDWQDPNQKGVLYYTKSGRVRGVLLWNVWSKIDAARALIAESGPIKPQDLIGKIR